MPPGISVGLLEMMPDRRPTPEDVRLYSALREANANPAFPFFPTKWSCWSACRSRRPARMIYGACSSSAIMRAGSAIPT